MKAVQEQPKRVICGPPECGSIQVDFRGFGTGAQTMGATDATCRIGKGVPT
jgi:hypothetical protein